MRKIDVDNSDVQMVYTVTRVRDSSYDLMKYQHFVLEAVEVTEEAAAAKARALEQVWQSKCHLSRMPSSNLKAYRVERAYLIEVNGIWHRVYAKPFRFVDNEAAVQIMAAAKTAKETAKTLEKCSKIEQNGEFSSIPA